jgi:uncharacterized membrane protein YgcG
MGASFGSLSVIPWILFAQASWNMMDAVPPLTAAQPQPEVAAEIRDRGEMFSRGAERRAREALWRIDRNHRIPVHIETIKSLDGAWIADVAERRARAADADQLYILVAGSERDVGVIAARHGPASRLTDQQRETIRRAFLGPIQAGETDGALEQGVRAIGTTLADPATAEPKSEVWGLLIAMTLLLGFWAVVYAAQSGANSMDWGRWRRGKAARAAGEPPTPHLTPGASVPVSVR